jgi:ATP-binding cassette subfamily B protein
MAGEKQVSFQELNFSRSKPFRTLLRIFKPEKRNIALALIVLTVKHSPALFLPIIIGNVINAVIAHNLGTLNTILVNSLFIMVLLIQNIFTHTLFVKYLSKANRSVEHNLRHALVNQMQALSISFHDNFESGKLHTKVLRDAESIEILSRQLANVVFIGILNVIFALVASVFYDWLVASFFLLTIPMAIFIAKFFQKRMTKTNKEYRSQLETMTARLSEMVQMIPIARAHAVEETEIRQMGEHLTRVKEKGIKLDVLNAIFGASSWVSFQSYQFVCLLVTAYMAYIGRIEIGYVVMFQGFFSMIINSVNAIITISPEINRGLDSINSLGEILECPDIELNEGKMKLKSVKGQFRFENINFQYNKDNFALKDFSLKIQPGESIAVIGESGSGKSTLMNLIIGYRRPTKGKILLDNFDMQDIDLRTYRKYIAVVPQNIVLFSGSVRENILYGYEHFDVPEEKILEVINMARLDDLIKQLPDGLDTLIGEHGDKLSGGQKQRIAIARALIRDPRVIIFDEATSALDVESEKYIQDSIAEMIEGRTTFIVAHRLSTIRKATHIIILDKGSIVETGSHAELLLKNCVYARMVAMQSI